MTYISLYDRRVKLVQDTLKEHSDIGTATAQDLAVQVLRALDSVPETVR